MKTDEYIVWLESTVIEHGQKVSHLEFNIYLLNCLIAFSRRSFWIPSVRGILFSLLLSTYTSTWGTKLNIRVLVLLVFE